MTRQSFLTLASVSFLLAVLAASPSFAQCVSGTRTFTSTNFFVDWSTSDPSDPELIDIITWMGGSSLTNTFATGVCADGDAEFFGNSWQPPDPQVGGKVFVGSGTTGTWTCGSGSTVQISSVSIATSCPPQSAGIPVDTEYKFYSSGPAANKIRVMRKFYFGGSVQSLDFRPYIARLYPRSDFTQVKHPNAAGTALVTETAASCESGCIVTDWDATDPSRNWFAVHDPGLGRGLIVRRASTTSGQLWIDQDFGSLTTASSVLLQAPVTGTVTEVQFLCFYDSTIWTPSLVLPAGC